MAGAVVRTCVHLTRLPTIASLALAVRQNVEITAGAEGLLLFKHTLSMAGAWVTELIFRTSNDGAIVTNVTLIAFACAAWLTQSLGI